MFRAGDIVEIPLPGERTAVGRLLHISEYFKNVVCFIVFGLKANIDLEHLDRQRHSEPMFTALEAIEYYGWKAIRRESLSTADRELTIREVGGGVYVEDKYLGSVEELGGMDLRPMLVSGMRAVYARIEEYIGDHSQSEPVDENIADVSTFREGDIVEIPLPDGRAAVGWILHISQRFNGAVGFIVFGIKGQARDDVALDCQTGRPLSMPVLGPLYTHIDAVRQCGWRTFSHQPIFQSKRMLTKRRVGGDVYVGDECVGSVEELDGFSLKPMLALEMAAVYSEIENAFGKAT